MWWITVWMTHTLCVSEWIFEYVKYTDFVWAWSQVEESSQAGP
jgi:hypothetical protein